MLYSLELLLGFCCVALAQPASQQLPVVAFTEGQTSSIQFGQGQTLSFSKIITSIGGGVDQNGVFTCQTPGLYAFHFYSLTDSGTEMWLDIYKNDVSVGTAYAHASGGYGDAGNSVILNLVQGDRVYVRTHEQYANAIFGAADQIYSTLTGVLLDSGVLEINGLDRTGSLGFTAALDKNVTFSSGGIVIFNHPIGDITGSGYDVNSGNFTAPVDGTYVFHMHALAAADFEVFLDIYHNDNYVISSYEYTQNDYSSTGNSVILHLTKGDKVYVRTDMGTNVALFGSATELYCSFSGALLALTTHGNHPDNGNHGTSEIAFSVGLTKNAHGTAGDKVIYDRIFVNQGGAYDTTTGVATAPVSGVYMFHFHGLSQDGEEIYLELYRNYIYEVSLYGYDPTSYAAGSNAVALSLNKGDQVYIGMQSDTRLYGGVDEVYCTFSGYLVSPTDSGSVVVGK